MTDTRLAALERVVEAARVQHEAFGACPVLIAALRALDALPAPQPVETVTLAVWEDTEDGDTQLARIGGKMDAWRLKYRNWTRLGTVTLPLTPEAPK